MGLDGNVRLGFGVDGGGVQSSAVAVADMFQYHELRSRGKYGKYGLMGRGDEGTRFASMTEVCEQKKKLRMAC